MSQTSRAQRYTAIKCAYEGGHQDTLAQLLDPLQHLAGRQKVLQDAEEDLACHRALEVSQKGFAMDMRTMQSL